MVVDARPLRIIRDPDRARLEANEEDVTAVGTQLPNGTIYIQWRKEAFEPGDRSEGAVESRYESVEDAEQATAGHVQFVDGEEA